MWQVSGRSDITDFEEVVRLDKEYITNWNIGLKQQMEDVEIIKSFRSMKLDSRELLVLLDGIQKGTVTIQISERFPQRLDGLYGHSIKVIPLFFFRPASDPCTASGSNGLCITGIME